MLVANSTVVFQSLLAFALASALTLLCSFLDLLVQFTHVFQLLLTLHSQLLVTLLFVGQWGTQKKVSTNLPKQ